MIAKLSLPLGEALLGASQDPAGKLRLEAPLPPEGIAFLGRTRIAGMMPVYPEIVRTRRAEGLSALQIAEQTRQRYPRRALRQPFPTRVPDLSRTYLLDPEDPSEEGVAALLARLQSDPEVEHAERERLVRAAGAGGLEQPLPSATHPNDPFLWSSGSWGNAYRDLWGHWAIDAPKAWSSTLGDGVLVAVVDTGIDYYHPDLQANLWVNSKEIAGNGIDDDGNGFVDDVRGWNFVGHDVGHPIPGNDPMDHHGHGTHVAGTIAATGDNGLGIIGIAWHSKVMAVKGLDDHGLGTESTLAQGIVYAARNGADVINASWSGEGYSKVLEEAIQFAYGLGVVFVAAAGNSSADVSDYYPGNLPEAITVGSGTSALLDSFSNFGAKVDVVAPGSNILSLRAAGTTLGVPVQENYVLADGTSMAAPHVSGVTALLLSRTPHLPIESVRQILRSSATSYASDGWDPESAYGFVNAAQALNVPAPLRAHIASPMGGRRVNAPILINGVAEGAGFDHYLLEIGRGMAPSVWTTLQVGTRPVQGGTLGTVDPSAMPDGSYLVRLSVFDAAGHAFRDRMELIVQYVALTSPMPPKVPVTANILKPGAIIPLIGMATGPSFQGFRLEWARGIHPLEGWNRNGVTLTGAGNSPVPDGQLGTWDTTGITLADYYTIRATVQNAGFTSQAETLVYLEPDLLSSKWPVSFQNTPTGNSGLVPSKDGSGANVLELVLPPGMTTTAPGRFLKFTPGGIPLPSPAITEGTRFTPSLGKVDLAPGLETVSPDLIDGISIFYADNSSKVIKVKESPGRLSFATSPVILEDLDGKGLLGIVAVGEDLQTQALHLYAWRSDGSLLNSGFPITLPPNQNPWMIGALNETPRVLVGDLDGDGVKDLVVLEGTQTNTFTLKRFSLEGNPIPWKVPIMESHPTKVLLADLDHNGRLEVLVMDWNRNLHVFQPDGSYRPGWPVRIPTPGDDVPGGHGLAVGDLDRDGRAEIVATSGTGIFVFRADGTSFSGAWPLHLASPQLGKEVVLADLDGDGFQEIIVPKWNLQFAQNPLVPQVGPSEPRISNLNGAVFQTHKGPGDGSMRWVETSVGASGYRGTNYSAPAILAFRLDGSLARSWRMLGSGGNQPFHEAVITVGDFDGDGRTDLAVCYPTILGGSFGGWLGGGIATVLSTGGTYKPQVNDWPMSLHDARNTSTLRSGGSPLPPQIQSIEAFPAFYRNGTGLTLSWSVSGADHLFLDHGVGEVTGLGSIAVTPSGKSDQAFTLTASNQGEFSSRTVWVAYRPLDLNGDGRVDLFDLAVLARAFGARTSDPNWNPFADLNNDGVVDDADLALLVFD